MSFRTKILGGKERFQRDWVNSSFKNVNGKEQPSSPGTTSVIMSKRTPNGDGGILLVLPASCQQYRMRSGNFVVATNGFRASNLLGKIL
ncbi:uncharacterized protein J3R85_003716 [Psidium guajava]|nr:uncharacterized protein J3R85_003716 [Psidium guajava]